jgi:hypothetical protein
MTGHDSAGNDDLPGRGMEFAVLPRRRAAFIVRTARAVLDANGLQRAQIVESTVLRGERTDVTSWIEVLIRPPLDEAAWNRAFREIVHRINRRPVAFRDGTMTVKAPAPGVVFPHGLCLKSQDGARVVVRWPRWRRALAWIGDTLDGWGVPLAGRLRAIQVQTGADGSAVVPFREEVEL